MQENRVVVGGVYKHFKGNLYKVVDVVTHSETKESLVSYKSFVDGKAYVRPYDMFISEVDHEKYPEVEQKFRFELVSEEKFAIATVKSEDNIYVEVSDVVHIDRIPEQVKALIKDFVKTMKILDNGLPASGFIGESGCKITGIFKYGEICFISYVGTEEQLTSGNLIHIFSNVTEEEYNKMKAYADTKLEELENEEHADS